MLYQLKREVSFVKSLPLDIAAIAVGWIYTILWIVCYYPQVFFWGKKRVYHFTPNHIGIHSSTTAARGAVSLV